MSPAINPASIETLAQIVGITTEKKHHPRVTKLTAGLKLAADDIMRMARGVEDHAFGAHSVVNGLVRLVWRSGSCRAHAT